MPEANLLQVLQEQFGLRIGTHCRAGQPVQHAEPHPRAELQSSRRPASWRDLQLGNTTGDLVEKCREGVMEFLLDDPQPSGGDHARDAATPDRRIVERLSLTLIEDDAAASALLLPRKADKNFHPLAQSQL